MIKMHDLNEENLAWREFTKAKKEKKEKNRINSTEILKKNGIPIQLCNLDRQIIIRLPTATIDFYPSTGLYKVRNTKIKHRGIKNLLQYISKQTGQTYTL